MRVLMLHNRYKLQGGEDESTLAESTLLQAFGDDVDLLELNNDAIPSSGNLRTAVRAIWSREAYERIQAHLSNKTFDVLHVQNFFPLWSPSVYYAATRTRTAVVQSVRNYRLICPAASLFRDGHHCVSCVGKRIAWPGVLHGCYHNSRLATGAVAAMTTTHRALGTWNKRVHQYIALTNYLRDQLIAGDFPANRISVKPNFIADPSVQTCQTPGNYFIYVGRLAKEKGLEILFNAWSSLKFDARLKLVGAGRVPDGLLVPRGVEILGQLSIDETYAQIGGAKGLILPALWAEPFGRVVIEAFALGIPVVASAAGGLPELIENDVTGILVEQGNAASLALAIDRLSADGVLCARLSKNARQAYVTRFSSKLNYEMLIAIYRRAIEVAAQPEP